jgi:hypothetical protein
MSERLIAQRRKYPPNPQPSKESEKIRRIQEWISQSKWIKNKQRSDQNG